MNQTSNSQPMHKWLVGVIVAGLLAWGILLATGAAWFGEHAYKPVVLLAAVGGFTGVWLALLQWRRHRKT